MDKASAQNPGRLEGGENMTGDCLIFVGSLNREAPYFQGARGVGLSLIHI